MNLLLQLALGCGESESLDIPDAVFELHTDESSEPGFTESEVKDLKESVMNSVDLESKQLEQQHHQIDVFQKALADDVLSPDEKAELIGLGVSENRLTDERWNYSLTRKQFNRFETMNYFSQP